MLLRIFDGFFLLCLLTMDLIVLMLALTPVTIWFLPLYFYMIRYPHVTLFNGVVHGS